MTESTAAYFDVDGTLLTLTTIFAFGKYYARNNGSEKEFAELLRLLSELRRNGIPRETTNRLYYRWWAGQSVSAVKNAANSWWKATSRLDIYNPRGMELWNMHGSMHSRRVFVSGSFFELLEPIAVSLGADAVLCSRNIVRNGIVTGEIEQPMVSAAKRDAVLRDLAKINISKDNAYAYGDHESDLPFMEVARHHELVSLAPGIPG